MKKAGLTGGIGAGKSVIAGVFSKLGISIYNSDARAKELIESDLIIIKELKKLLGKDIYNKGRINKELLTGYIFKNPEIKKKINHVVHPVVFNDWEEWSIRQTSPYVIMESALLFQTGYYKNLDATIAVASSEGTRAKRIAVRDNISAEESNIRIKSQGFEIPTSFKGLFIINNDGPEDMLLTQVLRIHEKLISE